MPKNLFKLFFFHYLFCWLWVINVAIQKCNMKYKRWQYLIWTMLKFWSESIVNPLEVGQVPSKFNCLLRRICLANCKDKKSNQTETTFWFFFTPCSVTNYNLELYINSAFLFYITDPWTSNVTAMRNQSFTCKWLFLFLTRTSFKVCDILTVLA